MTTSTLLGRDEELRALRDVLTAGARHGAVLVLLGEPGIGKTSMLAALRADASAEGSLVLGAVGIEAESQLPFAGLQQLLGPILDRTAELSEPLRLALLTAFGLESGSQPSIFLIAEATLALLEHCGSTQVLLADDVQWLDSQTDEILTYLGRRADLAGLTLIGAARLGHTCLFLSAGFDSLQLDGLSDEAGRELLGTAARQLSDNDRSAILAEAQGNPLALLELPKVWDAGSTREHPPLSARLERAFSDRITKLDPGTRDLLLVAAVDSSDDLEEIRSAAVLLGRGRPNVHSVDAAVTAGLVVVEDRRLRFRHPLMRSGVLFAEPVIRQQVANRAIAEVLVDDPFRKTWHQAQSIIGPDDRTADELVATVPESLRRGAAMTAVASLERAAELSSTSRVRGHRLLVGARLAFDSGRADVVDRLVTEATRTDLSSIDWARMQLLREMFDDGVPGDAIRVIELCDTARSSAAEGDVDLSLDLLMGAALRCWWADTGPAARNEVVAAVRTLTDAHDDARYVAAIAVADPVVRARDVSAMLARAQVERVDDAVALRLYGMAAHAIGDTPLATDLLDRAEVLLRERALLGLLPHVLGMQVHIRHELGDWAGARAAMSDVQRLTAETGQPIWSLNNRILAAQSEAFGGNWREALDLVAAAEIEADRRGLNDTLCLVRLAHGTALLSVGRADEAYERLRSCFDPTSPAYHQRESFSCLGFLAEAAARSGNVADAAALLPELERLSTVTSSPLLAVHLRYARAMLADDADAAEPYFLDAVAAPHNRWPWPRARLFAAYGEWLMQRGRAHDAASYLRTALATFDDIGAVAWATRARNVLGLGS